MTIPVLPGPFQFLKEAGEAAGEYGQVKEERKRHGEEVAYRATQSLIQEIVQGLRPASDLDSPEVQQTMKMAGFPPLTSKVLPQPREIKQKAQAEDEAEAVAEGGARRRAVTGVPSQAVAEAGEAQQVLPGRQAQAALDANLPQLQADAAAAQAEAQKLGATFNAQVYMGAADRFKDVKDPDFKKLAIEAATGILDYRIRLLITNREWMTVERQKLADKAKSLLEGIKSIDGIYKQVVDDYERQKRLDMVNAGWDPNDEKLQQKYEHAHPRPTMDEVRDNFLQKVMGVTPDEFKRTVRQGLGLAEATQPPPGTPPPATPPPGTPTLGDDYRKAIQLTVSGPPETTGPQLYEALRAGNIDIFTIRLMFSELKRTIPADQYKRLKSAYNSATFDITEQVLD